MGRSLRPSGYAMLVLLLIESVCSPLQAGQMKPGEKLRYTFSYQGIFSGFVPIEIADAVLEVQPESEIVQGLVTYQVTLDLTTESYPKAELLYPVRYRYRSWMEPDRQQPVLISEFLKTDETSEELLWFDRENQQGHRYVKADERQNGAAVPPGFLLQKADPTERDALHWAQKSRQEFTDRAVWGYLSLLYRLRFLDLQTDRVFELNLYNGKRIKQYRVEVTDEPVAPTEWNRAAFILKLFEVGGKSAKKKFVASVWVSNDELRLPLRFLVQQGFGELQGILHTGRPLTARQDGLSAATSQSLQLIF